MPYSVKPLNRFAGILNFPVSNGAKLGYEGRASRPSDWVEWLCNLRWLGTIGSAAAFALAVVLTFAAVIAGLTTAFALTVVFPFARMFVTLLVVREEQAN